MNVSGFRRSSFAVGIAAFALAGCGGLQPQLSAPGKPAQGRHLSKSTGFDYFYIPSARNGNVYLAPWHIGRKHDQTISGLDQPNGVCGSSNIWVATASDLIEYGQGGTTPIGSLNGSAFSCAIDPNGGNLAATWANTVSVWRNAQGIPTTYLLSRDVTLRYCGYDNAHNLFVDGYSGNKTRNLVFAELASGASTLQQLSVRADVGIPGGVAFDGTYVSLQDLKKPFEMYQLQVSGSTASVVNTVNLGRGFEWVGAMTMLQFSDETILFVPTEERLKGRRTEVFQATYPYMSNEGFTTVEGKGPYSAIALSEI